MTWFLDSRTELKDVIAKLIQKTPYQIILQNATHCCSVRAYELVSTENVLRNLSKTCLPTAKPNKAF